MPSISETWVEPIRNLGVGVKDGVIVGVTGVEVAVGGSGVLVSVTSGVEDGMRGGVWVGKEVTVTWVGLNPRRGKPGKSLAIR
jgi:hypothetical protein